jgi:hypothetical protein
VQMWRRIDGLVLPHLVPKMWCFKTMACDPLDSVIYYAEPSDKCLRLAVSSIVQGMFEVEVLWR